MVKCFAENFGLVCNKNFLRAKSEKWRGCCARFAAYVSGLMTDNEQVTFLSTLSVETGVGKVSSSYVTKTLHVILTTYTMPRTILPNEDKKRTFSISSDEEQKDTAVTVKLAKETDQLKRNLKAPY